MGSSRRYSTTAYLAGEGVMAVAGFFLPLLWPRGRYLGVRLAVEVAVSN